MKKIYKAKYLIALCAIMALTSCKKSFDEINQNPNSPTTAPATNILARGLITTGNTLFGTRLDIYYAGSYSGMLASIATGDYEYRVDINNDMWNNLFTGMSVFVDAGEKASKDGNTNLQAAALTMKVYAAQKATDMFGDMPYAQAFKLNDEILYPKYDKQKDVYTAMFAELKTAADLFKTGKGALGAGDFLFKGDAKKWQKFCNSLRLRLAIRVSNIDATTATNVIREVLTNPTDYPIMTSNDDNAYFYYPGVAPDEELWFEDSGVGNRAYGSFRMGDVLISALKANGDPRLPVYAVPNKFGVYNGYKFSSTQRQDPLNTSDNVSQIGDRFANDSKGFSPYMNCAEVYFILAEAYKRNLVTGDAAAAYTAGVTNSLKENGVSDEDIATFLAKPAVNFNTATSTQLQKIGTQKYISLFKQSVEAWSEARRTDIPLMTGVSQNYAASHNRPPFRMSYADQERTLNPDNFPFNVKVVDIFWGDQMWWDTRTGVN
ncbi:SusD/RagB family nutrient-binding outer membrane lipoprotein [Pedobacter changchengzhani]|uniref:SusD/RagB family nutrient-binding outer membrane lipoprotein n=1 Tax=Pedobacter changchengzhani TaxID=2529274 RepID=A0A4R5MKQ7_9SPHI|nr:SusD/RagB family nutrient-binding outer membrane lipoprotein [Pedobacter changchengzhani]TDG36241.1 SusD/RagB family nutrient-binding outer membrane lipoprotein [Pedobacter changchengzhani]